MEKLDDDMKNLFYSVGISDNDQVDKETIDFIYDFVEKNGGIEQVKKEMMIRPPPPPPPSGKCRVSQKSFLYLKDFTSYYFFSPTTKDNGFQILFSYRYINIYVIYFKMCYHICKYILYLRGYCAKNVFSYSKKKKRNKEKSQKW